MFFEFCEMAYFLPFYAHLCPLRSAVLLVIYGRFWPIVVGLDSVFLYESVRNCPILSP